MLKEQGDVYIKCKEKLNKYVYLKSDLTFTCDKHEASKFYIDNLTDDGIKDNDIITINVDNKRLICENGKLLFKELPTLYNDKFKIKDVNSGYDIFFNSPVTFIFQDNNNMFLSHEWNSPEMLEDNKEDVLDSPSKPFPTLALSAYNPSHSDNVEFYIEKADIPPINSYTIKHKENNKVYKHKEHKRWVLKLDAKDLIMFLLALILIFLITLRLN